MKGFLIGAALGAVLGIGYFAGTMTGWRDGYAAAIDHCDVYEHNRAIPWVDSGARR